MEEYNPRVHLAEKRLREAAGLAELAADEIAAGICNAPFHDSVLDKLFYRIYTDVKVNHDQGFHVDDTCIPVSYTHLDVYKRQIYRTAN